MDNHAINRINIFHGLTAIVKTLKQKKQKTVQSRFKWVFKNNYEMGGPGPKPGPPCGYAPVQYMVNVCVDTQISGVCWPQEGKLVSGSMRDLTTPCRAIL